MKPNSPLGIAKLKIMEAVPYIRKTGRIKAGDGGGPNYTFASERDLIMKVRPLLVKYGITVTCVSTKVIPGVNTASGKASRVIEAVYRFTHVESGDYEDQATVGEGTDSGDKGAPKAMTGGQKYALRQWLLVETGDDPDKPQKEDKPPEKRLADGLKRIAGCETKSDLKTLSAQIHNSFADQKLPEVVFKPLVEALKKREAELV